MKSSLNRTIYSLPIAALVFSLGACASRQAPPPETAGNDEALSPNSADINQEEMKEAEKEAEQRRIEATEEAVENVDEASVIKTDNEALTTDDVDTDPHD